MGVPQKWMVNFMENHTKMDDLGVPPCIGNPPPGICGADEMTVSVSIILNADQSHSYILL